MILIIKHSLLLNPELPSRVEKMEKLSEALLGLPASHYETLKYLLGHLYRLVFAQTGRSGGGEWSFQKYGSRKIFLKFLRSRTLDFCAKCQRLGVSNFCKVVSNTIDFGVTF